MMTVKANLDGMRRFTERVVRRAERAREKVLKKSGAYVRQVAKNSLRSVPPKDKRYSKPGEAPFSRLGHLKHMILFAYDHRTKSVVVGPALIRSSSQVPRILERGGTETVLMGKERKPTSVRYQARPYMVPAVMKSLDKIKEHWRDQIK